MEENIAEFSASHRGNGARGNLKIDINNSSQDTEEVAGNLSPKSLRCVEKLIHDLKSKTVIIDEDETGKVRVEYENEVKKNKRDGIMKDKMAHIDMSKSNLISTPKNKDDMTLHIEALCELIDIYKKNKYPSGVCSDNKMVTPKCGLYREGNEFTKTKEILGKGNVAGEIIVVKDTGSNKEHALKTVMISSFRPEELKMWINLNDEDFVPSLLMVRLEKNKCIFHMEKLENAVTLREVIDEQINLCEPNIRPVSLCILHGLLSSINKMHSKNVVHRDLHPGNALVQNNHGQLDLKIIDFGLGQEKCHPDGPAGVRNDILMVFRMFSALYLGQEFDSIDDVVNNGSSKLEEMSYEYKLNEEDRKEILQLFNIFLHVTNLKSKDFGKSEMILKHVEGVLDKREIDKDEVLQFAAQQLFPDKIPLPLNIEDDVDTGEKYDSVDMLEPGAITFNSVDSNISNVSVEFIDEILNDINLQAGPAG
ncbi:uncharacterized protein LOC126816697 [Patella vulgata]|uniref:uncharacterized protein LOC126816697 n=1 Tax=Patella vulgata TaxID=6465 RepID=UPI00217FD0F4|nr:uncharacterized protein LOC126816697 [Patella vulgata]